MRVATVYSNYSFVGTLPALGFLKNNWTKIAQSITQVFLELQAAEVALFRVLPVLGVVSCDVTMRTNWQVFLDHNTKCMCS